MAPEIIKEEPYDQRVDIWSTGVIAYILLSGRPPFRGKTKPEIFHSISNNPLKFDHEIWAHVSDEAKDFIMKSLIKDKTKRPDAKELINHPWMNKFVRQQEVVK